MWNTETGGSKNNFFFFVPTIREVIVKDKNGPGIIEWYHRIADIPYLEDLTPCMIASGIVFLLRLTKMTLLELRTRKIPDL